MLVLLAEIIGTSSATILGSRLQVRFLDYLRFFFVCVFLLTKGSLGPGLRSSWINLLVFRDQVTYYSLGKGLKSRWFRPGFYGSNHLLLSWVRLLLQWVLVIVKADQSWFLGI